MAVGQAADTMKGQDTTIPDPTTLPKCAIPTIDCSTDCGGWAPSFPRGQTNASHRLNPPSLLFLLFLLLPLVAGATIGYPVDATTIFLNPGEFSTYQACISAHGGDANDCRGAIAYVTTTVPPETITTVVEVLVTASVTPSSVPITKSATQTSTPAAGSGAVRTLEIAGCGIWVWWLVMLWLWW